jgi:hypothetical protein
MRVVEEERRRWAASYEEKSVMIEQLQRELASTVEALNVERSFDKGKLLSDMPSHSDVDGKSDNARRNMDKMQREYSDDCDISGNGYAANHGSKNQTLLDEVESLKDKIFEQQRVEDALRYQIDELSIELEHTKNAWRDSEGKLQFRSNQVLNVLLNNPWWLNSMLCLGASARK